MNRHALLGLLSNLTSITIWDQRQLATKMIHELERLAQVVLREPQAHFKRSRQGIACPLKLCSRGSTCTQQMLFSFNLFNKFKVCLWEIHFVKTSQSQLFWEPFFLAKPCNHGWRVGAEAQRPAWARGGLRGVQGRSLEPAVALSHKPL